jgi:hypothetical protein
VGDILASLSETETQARVQAYEVNNSATATSSTATATGTHQVRLDGTLLDLVKELSGQVAYALSEGKHVLLQTTREFEQGSTLSSGAVVSRVLTSIVEALEVQPAFIVAKGGITSHEVAEVCVQ